MYKHKIISIKNPIKSLEPKPKLNIVNSIDDLAETEPKQIKISIKLPKTVKYSRNVISKEYKESLYFNKIEDYIIETDNILLKKASPFEPIYVIPNTFDISDVVYNPYMPESINSPLNPSYSSAETNEFREKHIA